MRLKSVTLALSLLLLSAFLIQPSYADIPLPDDLDGVMSTVDSSWDTVEHYRQMTASFIDGSFIGTLTVGQFIAWLGIAFAVFLGIFILTKFWWLLIVLVIIAVAALAVFGYFGVLV